jgi:3-oxoacyl-ACP reductase-like protein
MAKSKRTATDPATHARPASAAAPATPAAPDALEQLRQLKLNLDATSAKLMLIATDRLSDDDFRALGKQNTEVSLAINKLRNATLLSLSDEFKAELPAFSTAAKKLNDDLDGLKKAVDIIKAVSGALGVISKIVTLVG